MLARMFEKSRRADVTADEAAPYDGFMTGKHSQPFFREIGWDSPERPLAARRAQVVTTDGIPCSNRHGSRTRYVRPQNYRSSVFPDAGSSVVRVRRLLTRCTRLERESACEAQWPEMECRVMREVTRRGTTDAVV